MSEQIPCFAPIVACRGAAKHYRLGEVEVPALASIDLDITAGDFETCNLGYIIEEDRRAWGQRQRAYRFELNPCVDPWPPNFQGFVYPAERMQVQIVAVAGNARSDVLSIEIAWDGEWGHTAEEMQHHLAVNETGFSRPP